MTVLYGVLAYFAVMAGILLFFRFVRSADTDLREMTLEAPELRTTPAVAQIHRRTA